MQNMNSQPQNSLSSTSVLVISFLFKIKCLSLKVFFNLCFILEYSWFTMLCFRCTAKQFSYHIFIFFKKFFSTEKIYRTWAVTRRFHKGLLFVTLISTGANRIFNCPVLSLLAKKYFGNIYSYTHWLHSAEILKDTVVSICIFSADSH